MLMVVCIIVGILLTIINRYSPSEWSKIPEAEDKTNSRDSFTINNALFFVHTTVTWQGEKGGGRLGWEAGTGGAGYLEHTIHFCQTAG